MAQQVRQMQGTIDVTKQPAIPYLSNPLGLETLAAMSVGSIHTAFTVIGCIGLEKDWYLCMQCQWCACSMVIEYLSAAANRQILVHTFHVPGATSHASLLQRVSVSHWLCHVQSLICCVQRTTASGTKIALQQQLVLFMS